MYEWKILAQQGLSHIIKHIINEYFSQEFLCAKGVFGTEVGQDKAGRDKLLCIMFGRSMTELLTVLLCVWYGGWDKTGQEVQMIRVPLLSCLFVTT